MPRRSDPTANGAEADTAGPRAILRVPEVLMALAAKPAGCSLAELSPRLGVPKTSLHRLLRTLERGGYLTGEAGLYRLGPASFELAGLIGRSAPASTFPACARPTLERLAQETRETVMLGLLSGNEPEILYVDVIDSDAPIRFTLSAGDRRPLYCAASGMAVLAFLPAEAQRDYVRRTAFTAFTAQTSRKQDMAGLLREIGESAVAFDDGGKVIGASGIASPIFDGAGAAFASISVAGPSERIAAHRARLEPMVRSAGERISRLVGYAEAYPPTG
jgi:DNA-binding IclR family transcriptional regulator